ncbi:hypothetical protein KSS87_000383 [Heliosperma pusillum]|nr:hypothetical protein KSS87_000383 [Heliosperma pusillum]
MELFRIHVSLPNSLLVLTPPLSHKQSHLFPKSPQFSLQTLNKSSPNSLITKRSLNFSLITLIVSLSLPFNAPFSLANGVELKSDDDQLEKYTDFQQGFTLLTPTSYIKVDKAGATALFEEVNKGANNVGVVVTPVRLSSLTDFGTPQFVADKLIQAEKRKALIHLVVMDVVMVLSIGENTDLEVTALVRPHLKATIAAFSEIKPRQPSACYLVSVWLECQNVSECLFKSESTNDAGVIAVSERSGLGGLPVYEFEYFVDSTRGGLKRVFSAAFVSEKKLYLLNITHSDKPESPLDSHTRKMLEQVLHSFDALPSTKNST